MQDNEVQQSNNSSRLLLARKETNNKNKNKSLQQQTSSWCPEPSTHINNPWTSDSGPRCVKRGLCRSKPRKKKKKKIMRALRSGPLLDPCTAAVGGWGSNVRWQPGKHTRPAVLHVPYICGGWRATWSRQPRASAAWLSSNEGMMPDGVGRLVWEQIWDDEKTKAVTLPPYDKTRVESPGFDFQRMLNNVSPPL